MIPFDRSPVFRLQVPAPGGEAPRQHPKQPHPPSRVAQVRNLIETTRLPHRIIAERTGVDKGTVSRWSAKHGWTRPPGAWPGAPRPATRYVPNVIGRALAQHLRIQAERLVAGIECAETVDPAALAEAIGLLERARAEQRVRRSKKLVPPPPLTAEEIAAKAEAEHAAQAADAEHRQLATAPLPSPHRPAPAWQQPFVWKWDRRESAIQGWKARYARMRDAGVRFKKDR
jgi:hypothetical protein